MEYGVEAQEEERKEQQRQAPIEATERGNASREQWPGF